MLNQQPRNIFVRLILSNPSFQAQVFVFPDDYNPEIAFGITSGIVLGTMDSPVLISNHMALTGKEVMKEKVKIKR